MCPESIPRIWLHPPAVATQQHFPDRQPPSSLQTVQPRWLPSVLFPPCSCSPFHLFLFFCSSVFCPSVILSLFLFFSVLLSFCSSVLLSSFPFSFFFCSFVLLSSVPFSLLAFVLLSFCLPFPPVLYNIIRCSPFLRVLPALDLCQER